MVYSESKLYDQFEFFLKSYRSLDGRLLYREQITRLASEQKRSIVINYQDIIKFDPELAVSLVESPGLAIGECTKAAIETLKIENFDYAQSIEREFKVRIRGLPERLNLRNITSKYIDKLISLGGMVVRTSEIMPLLKVAAFICPSGHVTYVIQKDTLLKLPSKCSQCNETRNFDLDRTKSVFTDFQILRIQELPEELPPGQLPQYIDIEIDGDVVNVARPGDRIIVTGIIRAEGEKNKKIIQSSLFKIKLEGLYIEELSRSNERIEITPEDEEKIKELTKTPDLYQNLIFSLAPGIYGHNEIKEALLLMSVGSPQVFLPDGQALRGDINVLLVGDPGTAKSELLKYVSRLAPRALYTSGRGSTAAGLTAAVVKEANGMMMLEAGAVVLADQGIACIDEFDKMKPEDRGVLHEVMEQQSYHPSFEISLANGSRMAIGSFVDDLFKKNPLMVIQGKDCEILPVIGGPEIQTCEIITGKIVRTHIHRVSRHKAPEKFVVIKYSNGRQIIVTPEHPVFVYRGGDFITTVPAIEIKKYDYAPVPIKIPNSSDVVLLKKPSSTEQTDKEMHLPDSLSPELSKLLGFLISGGNFYTGNSYEINFSNADPALLKSVEKLFNNIFHLVPSIQVKGGVTIQRYISKPLFMWFKENFPEVLANEREKRVPYKILGSSVKNTREFLASAFLCDGYVKTTAICYRTRSPKLAEDYQDLLHKLGIMSRITHDDLNNFFNVCMTDNFAHYFINQVSEDLDKRLEKVRTLNKNRSWVTEGDDVLPPQIVSKIINLMDALGLKQSNYFHGHTQFGINRRVVEKCLTEIENKIKKFEAFSSSSSPYYNLRQDRKKIGISQQKLATICKIKRTSISYLEKGRYDASSQIMVQTLRKKVKEYSKGLQLELQKVKSLIKYEFIQISATEIVKNEGNLKCDWVYDITIEPTHNFISKGLILHNTVSVAKGGIVATLNARTSIVAAANPLLGKYDTYKNLYENINLPIPLLNRFDLIFIIRDIPNRETDEKLADHILEIRKKSDYVYHPPIEFNLLRKYLEYVKRANPKLSVEASEKIKAFYLEMRGSSQEGTIAITARQLETLIRLTLARARLLLKENADAEDATRALELLKSMLETVGVDVRTKKFDIGGILQGKPASERSQLQIALETFTKLCGPKNMPVEEKTIIDELIKTGKFTNEDAVRIITIMLRNGQIYEKEWGKYSLV
ncbi:MAG: LAGLIDADG family homing endonuclease [Conexivisphaerales archaeon]